MPNERTEKPRSDLAQQRQPAPGLPLPPAHQIAHPLIVNGPEAVRDSHC
jgi:hypothetical protein